LLVRAVARRARCLFNPRAVVYHRSRGSLRRLFARFFNFGRGQIEMLGFIDERRQFARDMARTSLVLKYLGLLIVLVLIRANPLWLGVGGAAHYAYLVLSHRYITRYISRRDVLWAAPAVRFVSDLGMDCGRVWGLIEWITGGSRA